MEEQTKEWLERLYASSPGYFAITQFKRDGQLRKSKWFATSEVGQAIDYLETVPDLDTYLSVGTHSEPQQTRGGAKTIISIPGYWGDFDIGIIGHKPAELPNPETETEALKIIEGLPDPSMLMYSGGGLQGFWLFDKPWIFDPGSIEAKRAIDAWATDLEDRGKALGYHVDKVADLARLLRVPGSNNHKEGLIRPVQIRWTDKPATGRKELTPAKVVTRLVDQSTEHETSEPAPPLNSFEENVKLWDKILIPAGLSPVPNVLGSYWRPDKTAGSVSVVVTPLNPEVVVNYSESYKTLPHGEGQRLTREKVYGLLNNNAQLPSNLKLTPFQFPERFNFKQAKEDSANQQWIIENVIEKKQRVSVTAPAGAMKSLVLLNLACTLGLGLDTLGHTKEPISVMYLDYENGADDILDRVQSMGFTIEQLDSPECKLHIIHMPGAAYGWLDKAEGGLKLAAHAKALNAELVIVDTLSKVTQGEENANETYRDVMIYTSNVLQEEGISILFLDHTGHAGNRARGASAKPQNVDVSFVVTRGKGAKDNEQYWDKRPESNGKDRTGRGLKTFTLKTDDDDGKLVISLDTGSIGQSTLDIHAVALRWLMEHDLLKLGPRPMWTKAENIRNRPVGKSALEKALKAWQDASSDEQSMFI